jgi:hypothetical protein
MVNESDNLTPQELDDTITRLDIKAPDLLDDNRYDHYQTVLKSNVNAGQKILSSILLMDPYDPKPGELPLSFRLMGQRFVIDSYVFSNVVFDRIVFNKEKIWRGLPDPLDAMFVLGNDAALPLLEQELETYHYGSQLNALRYLVDSYTDEFWNQSLYNVWLNAIRSLNSVKERMDFPLFMQTTAWQQQKLNTQLSSWTQLRHDNLLYAKQSYTGGTACSYPHSYIEPYPDFYRNLAAFAHKASTFFADYSGNEMLLNRIIDFFKTMEPLMYKLERLATKELNHQPFTQEETDWLRKMLFHKMGSGVPPFSGWYADLYYRLGEYIQANYDGSDYLVADVHTQPTDRAGAPVGRILHVGVGKINLGVFLADAPSGNWQQTAYVGPVMSYYEKITENFDRLTDERWAELVNKGEIPKRPDWINSYLADARGNARPTGREIPGVLMTGIDKNTNQPKQFKLLQNHPNPFNPNTVITYTLPYETHVNLEVYDILGRHVATLVDDMRNKGEHSIEWQAHEFPSGVYLVRLITDFSQKTIKMMLVK